jgi:hypothetical protein
MAGILANSASKTMVGADTAVDNVATGYVTGEQVTLSTTPTGSAYVWGLSIPSGSVAARSGLSSSSDASVTFTPDVGGEYVLTCIVDSATTYVLRASVSQVAAVGSVGAVRLIPVADATVPAPATGATLYYSSTADAVAIKLPDGTVSTVDVT